MKFKKGDLVKDLIITSHGLGVVVKRQEWRHVQLDTYDVHWLKKGRIEETIPEDELEGAKRDDIQ